MKLELSPDIELDGLVFSRSNSYVIKKPKLSDTKQKRVQSYVKHSLEVFKDV